MKELIFSDLKKKQSPQTRKIRAKGDSYEIREKVHIQGEIEETRTVKDPNKKASFFDFESFLSLSKKKKKRIFDKKKSPKTVIKYPKTVYARKLAIENPNIFVHKTLG